MKCKVYPTVKKHNRYIIAPSEVKVSDLPKQAQDGIGANKAWKEIELDPEQPLIGLDPNQAIKNIKSKGFHVQEVTVLFKEESYRRHL
jgi:uncharacterized protein YcgL (UPF0745 family)